MMDIVIGDTFKAKKTGIRYFVDRLEGDEITLKNPETGVEVDIYLDDVPVFFENLKTDVSPQTITLPVELLNKLIDALNDACTGEGNQVMDELTACAESQDVPVWFDNDRKPLWTTRPKGAERLVSYDQMTTDELLEALPHNLHVARNDNAPEHDRWRIYNTASGKYCEPGGRSAREVIICALNRLAEQYKAWTGRE